MLLRRERRTRLKWLNERHAELWRQVNAQAVADLAHDGAHVLRVYRWALEIGVEFEADLDLLGAAALVHDFVAIPKDSAMRKHASERSAEVAMPVLLALGYDEADCVAISEVVRTASWSRGEAPNSAEGAALQDADRLDAMGAVGIARTFCVAQEMSTRRALSLYHEEDPLACERVPDDRSYAVDHFFVKLLGLETGMHSETAKAEAARRGATMRAFLTELERELRCQSSCVVGGG